MSRSVSLCAASVALLSCVQQVLRSALPSPCELQVFLCLACVLDSGIQPRDSDRDTRMWFVAPARASTVK